MDNALTPATPGSDPAGLPSHVSERIRRLIRRVRRRDDCRRRRFSLGVSWLLEECLPHKTGRFKGTRVGYDPRNRNANCLRLLYLPAADKSPVQGPHRPVNPGHLKRGLLAGRAATRQVPRTKTPGSATGAARSVRGSAGKSVPEQDNPSVDEPVESVKSKADAGKIRSTVGVENERRLKRTELGGDYEVDSGQRTDRHRQRRQEERRRRR